MFDTFVKTPLTIDNTKNMALPSMRVLNRIAKSQSFIKAFYKKLNINYIMTNDIWEAFKVARDKLYPEPKTDWNLISARQAVKVMDNKISLYNLLKFVKNGTFRAVDQKVYQEEVELFKIIFDLKDIFVKSGALLESKDAITQKEVIAVIPKQLDKLKKGTLDQEMLALQELINNDFTKEFLQALTK